MMKSLHAKQNKKQLFYAYICSKAEHGIWIYGHLLFIL